MTKTYNKKTKQYEWDKPAKKGTTTKAKPATSPATVELEATVARLEAKIELMTACFEGLGEAKTLKQVREIAKLLKL